MSIEEVLLAAFIIGAVVLIGVFERQQRDVKKSIQALQASSGGLEFEVGVLKSTNPAVRTEFNSSRINKLADSLSSVEFRLNNQGYRLDNHSGQLRDDVTQLKLDVKATHERLTEIESRLRADAGVVE